MRNWPSGRVLALLLGVLLALSTSLSAVQAGAMSLDMAMAAQAGASWQSACDGCGGSDEGSSAVSCASALTCFGAAVLPSDRNTVTAELADLFVLVFGLAPGLAAPPDPYPPKSGYLG